MAMMYVAGLFPDSVQANGIGSQQPPTLDSPPRHRDCGRSTRHHVARQSSRPATHDHGFADDNRKLSTAYKAIGMAWNLEPLGPAPNIVVQVCV